jgi:F-type H+-transporting ATPase subunit b
MLSTPARAQSTQAATPAASQPAGQQEVDKNAAYRESPHVVEWGAKLGLNPEQSATASEITNFVLLAVCLAWLVLRVVPKIFPEMVPRNRTQAIQKSLGDARTATEEARARLTAVEERLSKLDGEIAAMRTHAEQASVAEEQRIKASVEDEKKKILAAAEQEIAAATMHAQKRLQQHAAELAIEQAARKLVVSAETDRLLVQGFAQRLGGDESKKGQN